MSNQRSGLVAEEKQALLAAIVSSSQDAIVSKTLKGVITSWNPAAERLFGYKEREVLGKHISLIIPEDRIHEEDFILEQIGRGQRIEHFETVRKAKNGTLIPISLTISPVFNERKEIIGASKIARDISEMIASKLEKERLYEEVNVLSRKKDEFIALAAHELKTPITSLRGFMEVLQLHATADSLQAGLLERCVRQTNKLTTLLNDLLDVSRLQIGKLLLRCEKFDLVAMVQEVLSGFTHSARHRFIFKNKKPVVIYADRIRLEQVLTNLLNNAVKYTPAGGTVTIKMREAAGKVYVSVRDEGLGIEPEHLTKIFNQFYRAVDPGANISGLGIGLYISKEIITRHGGTIGVKSRKGSGSVFVFSIPKQYQQ
ncbi:PAS domain S-box protein [Niabella sp. CC-SYL272]|uniref:PAS domain-containing sensor histidine kinase n=1 Tax=Niabella agricola TaxID=2891571 RepID=UPI001F470E51|nr:ATP-binding protein [Niabella agricola]MCF3107605.1 PAS domain S-box protein [Niabella agricola]